MVAAAVLDRSEHRAMRESVRSIARCVNWDRDGLVLAAVDLGESILWLAAAHGGSAIVCAATLSVRFLS